MANKSDQHKYSSARLYEFTPNENIITSNNIVELANVIKIGISGHTFQKLSPELQQHFKKVS
jgi:hypothetical protein